MGTHPSTQPFDLLPSTHIIPKNFNMAHYLSLLALAAFAGASPIAQGVTDAVAPSATAPAACSTDYASRFGIAVMSAAANAAAPAATVSQIADGQVQAARNSRVCYDVDSQGRTVSQIADGQIQAPTSTPAPSMTMMGVSQIGMSLFERKESLHSAAKHRFSRRSNSRSGVHALRTSPGWPDGVHSCAGNQSDSGWSDPGTNSDSSIYYYEHGHLDCHRYRQPDRGRPDPELRRFEQRPGCLPGQQHSRFDAGQWCRNR